MARAKNTQVVTDENKGPEVIQDSQSKPTDAEINKSESVTESQQEAAESQQATSEVKEVVIPDNVIKVLKMYPNYKELWVDTQGGVYTTNCKNVNKNKAVLYQNPYYNNK
ncbi:hypothetical protein [Phocaeicola plebeius]|uniref:hypothetical protein n=1 Tax=Phocaeicola plebeius TaxID=310297 RepID=UPI003AB39710